MEDQVGDAQEMQHEQGNQFLESGHVKIWYLWDDVMKVILLGE